MVIQSVMDSLSNTITIALMSAAVIPMVAMSIKLFFNSFEGNAKSYVPIEPVCAYCGTKNSLNAEKVCKCCLAKN